MSEIEETELNGRNYVVLNLIIKNKDKEQFNFLMSVVTGKKKIDFVKESRTGKPIYIGKMLAKTIGTEFSILTNFRGIAVYSHKAKAYMARRWANDTGRDRRVMFDEDVLKIKVPKYTKDFIVPLASHFAILRIERTVYQGFGTATSSYLDWVSMRRDVTLTNVCKVTHDFIN